MRPISVVTILSVVAVAACAHEGASPQAAASPAQSAPASIATTASGTAPANAKKAGTIVGTVVTDPYNAIKKGAVIYLEDGPKEPRAGMSVVIDNHDMSFVPFLAVVTAGGTVTFGNTDPFVHNAFSPDNETWDIGEIPTHGAVPKTFDKPGAYTVLCNLHKNMLSYLVVTPSSYFAKSDADGKYTMSVPPGTYHVTAWAPRLKAKTQTVTVTDGEVTSNVELGR
jgi:plastocyanin